jgi:hypothetical protein
VIGFYLYASINILLSNLVVYLAEQERLGFANLICWTIFFGLLFLADSRLTAGWLLSLNSDS